MANPRKRRYLKNLRLLKQKLNEEKEKNILLEEVVLTIPQEEEKKEVILTIPQEEEKKEEVVEKKDVNKQPYKYTKKIFKKTLD